jgi:phospholipase D
MKSIAANLLPFLLAAPAFAAKRATATISVCFTPAELCEVRVVGAIDKA